VEFRLFHVPLDDVECRLATLAAEGWDVVSCWPARSQGGFWTQAPLELMVLGRRPARSWPVEEET
jgi:hypothetical protein